jgi:hypothetical protein
MRTEFEHNHISLPGNQCPSAAYRHHCSLSNAVNMTPKGYLSARTLDRGRTDSDGTLSCASMANQVESELGKRGIPGISSRPFPHEQFFFTTGIGLWTTRIGLLSPVGV